MSYNKKENKSSDFINNQGQSQSSVGLSGQMGLQQHLAGIGQGIGSGIGSGIGAGIGAGFNSAMNLSNTQAFDNAGINESEEGEEYVPNEKEIHGYAEFLGMDPVTDKEFLYIAVAGLQAPVPEPWITQFDENDEIFYVNSQTGQKMLDHPLDEHYRQMFLNAKAEKEGKNFNSSLQKNNNFSTGQNDFKNQKLNNMVLGSGGIGNSLNNKTQDPLIRAEAEKKIREQRLLYQQEFNYSIEEIERNFQLRKQELIRANELEIEQEKQKWDRYKKEQEKKIKEEIEQDIDQKIFQFKEKLKKEEENEIKKIEEDTKQKLKDFEKELNQKIENEKQGLIEYYERIRKTVDESEQERFDFEIEKFKKDQGRLLDSKKFDIEKLKSEKRKVQEEFDEQVEQLKKEMEKKFEREKRELNDQMQIEIEEIERDEKSKYEKKVQQMKRDLQISSAAPDMEKELQDFKQQLENEFDLQIREFRREQEKILQEEELRLEKSRQQELEDYEETLNRQFEAEHRRKQQQINTTRDQEQKELEISKLKIDQQYQDKVEQFRKDVALKYDREKRLFEEERQKRLYEIQDSIENLNLATSDKQKMRSEIDDLIQEQRRLQDKIQNAQKESEEQQQKNRQLQREIDELTIKINANKLTQIDSNEDPRIQDLRDEIAQRQVQISQAQREYKELLEKPRVEKENYSYLKNQSSPQKNDDSNNIQMLEKELGDIKKMLRNQNNQKNMIHQKNEDSESDAQAKLDNFDLQFGQQIQEHSLDNQILHDQYKLQNYIKQQKVVIKNAQEKLELCKKQYKEDKKTHQVLQSMNPSEYQKQKHVLEDVKQQIEQRVAAVNEKVEKIKNLEKQIQKY